MRWARRNGAGAAHALPAQCLAVRVGRGRIPKDVVCPAEPGAQPLLRSPEHMFERVRTGSDGTTAPPTPATDLRGRPQRRPHLELRSDALDDGIRELGGARVSSEIGGLHAGGDGLQHPLVDRA